MKLSQTIALAGLITSSCNSQQTQDPELTNSTNATRADISTTLNPEKSIPTEADLMRGQLTGECTPPGQPLSGEQFPMIRGTELIKTLSDGTCLERLKDGSDNVIYAINGNNKIKFANPNEKQEARILEQDEFEGLTNLGITLIEEAQTQKPSFPRSIFRPLIEEAQTQKPNSLRVLFEGPMDKCPTYRYRRDMLANITTVLGSECIWDEIQLTCPMVTTAMDSSQIIWHAFAEDGQYVIPNTGTHLMPCQLAPGEAPTPDEWLGRQPDCPKSNSVINIDF